MSCIFRISPVASALIAALATTLAFPSALHAREASHQHEHGSTRVSPAAEAHHTLPTVVVTDSKEAAAAMKVDANTLRTLRPATSDTASLLRDIPGVSLHGAGGVSSLPVIHGLADDRLRIRVDEMDLIASCPNHMNPALSYVDPAHIGRMEVYAGVSPVSVGGDSIGGSILVETLAPRFAAPGQDHLFEGEAGAFYRSNGKASGANLSTTYATESFSIHYAGATAKSGNYTAGGNFKTFTATGRDGHRLDRDEVGSTAYETRNHTLGIAFRGGDHLFEARIGYQDLPYQYYPNQRMDMFDNTQKRINLRYLRQFARGALEARAYREKVDHSMDFGDDKQLVYGSLPRLDDPAVTLPVVGMPMRVESVTHGFSLLGDLNLSGRDQLRVGGLLQTYRLDDAWSPTPDCGVGNCIGGMAPLTFRNIHDGKRDRKALFGEWDAEWNPRWSSLLGLRVERVTTDTGRVSGYTDRSIPGATGTAMTGMPFGMMYDGSSVGTRHAFNAMNRKRSDTNWDFSAMVAYHPGENFDMRFGFARKTRSPNLYERYSWSTNTMALVMNNFVGDGNGYVGNPDLKPEVAHTLSLTADWHSADREYRLMLTPYYTRVNDYIDAQRAYPGAPASNATDAGRFVRLQYVNQRARLYGFDLSGKLPLGRTAIGHFGLKGLLNYTNGRNRDTGDDLYNIMPLNAKLTLTHHRGGWDNALELVAAKGKSDVSGVRNEIGTSGYHLVNLRSSYSWRKVRVDFGVENLFDKFYFLPLGGAYVGQGGTMGINAIPWGIAVPGMGRSIHAGVRVKF
ncbi:MAG: TonB-dependent receptor [Candidatus Accumulibacter sp.]|jgi:iron complex outermembrane receptor protein|nr:TonB-dependent receptor [Accumulibacter sp.]